MTAVVLEAAVRSAALILLVWAALALIRPRNAHALKALWTSVLVASFGMPLLMHVHVAPAVAAPVLRWTIRPGGAALSPTSGLRALGALVYVVPALLLVLRHGLAWARLCRIRREARALSGPWPEGLDVRASARISSPATFGMTILLPEESSTWSRSKLAAVAAHEGAHVLHRDCYVLWLARLHACLFWFDPLAWWLARRLAQLAEQTSDEAAVASLGSGVDYAEILLGLRMQRTSGSGMATAMASSDLPARIDRILSGVTASRRLARPQVLLLVAAVLPAAALAAAPLRLARGSGGNSTQASTGARASTAGAPASTAGDGRTRLEPRVISSPPLERYYPREAMHKGIDGMVELAITLDRAGRATDTQILREYPLDMGFGAAASALAHVMQYSNPTGQQVTFTLQIKFALSHAPAEQARSSSASGG